MAKHGEKKHMKRIAAPRKVSIPRKGDKFIERTSSGPHPLTSSVPLSIVLRDYLKLAKNMKEVKSLLDRGLVLVDNRIVKNTSFPVGLMDVISIPDTSLYYRCVTSPTKYYFLPISEKSSKFKLCKITNKKIVKGGAVQLSFHDARTVIIQKEEDVFKVGDSIKLSIPEQKVLHFYKLQKGAECYIFKGRHAGSYGRIEKITEYKGRPAMAVIKNKSEKITLKKYLFAIDEEFKKEIEEGNK